MNETSIRTFVSVVKLHLSNSTTIKVRNVPTTRKWIEYGWVKVLKSWGAGIKSNFELELTEKGQTIMDFNEL